MTTLETAVDHVVAARTELHRLLAYEAGFETVDDYRMWLKLDAIRQLSLFRREVRDGQGQVSDSRREVHQTDAPRIVLADAPAGELRSGRSRKARRFVRLIQRVLIRHFKLLSSVGPDVRLERAAGSNLPGDPVADAPTSPVPCASVGERTERGES